MRAHILLKPEMCDSSPTTRTAERLVAHFKDGVKLTLGVEMDYGLHDETGNPSWAARDSLYSIWGDLIDNDVVDAETLDKHCEEHTLHVLIEMYYPPCVCEEVFVGGKVLNVYSEST